MRTLTALVGAFMVTAATARADTAEEWGPDRYLTIVPFYVRADDARGTDDGQGIALGYGRRLRDRWYWEGQFFTDVLETGGSAATDFYQYGIGLDVQYRFRPGNTVSPFVLVGLGAIRNDVVPNADDAVDLFGNLGLGIVSRELGDIGLRFRADARYVRDEFETGGVGGMDDWRVGVGLQIPLGRRVVEKEVMRDRIVTETIRVPAEIEDRDGDGVPDQIDDCPRTPAGAATDNRGCVPKGPSVTRLEGVNFETNSARLTPGATVALRAVAETLRGSTTTAEVAGHTDDAGSAGHNLQLSESRARAVVDFLVEQGIDRRRLRARGYGESRPVADNETAQGRRENRRVELRILE